MNKAFAPKVSVIMSVYNGEKYLEKSILSILNQTFQDFEFIIINDGSNDGSVQMLENFASRDSRINLYHQSNAGLIASLNRAASLAHGEYLARMDGDDIALPTRFEKQVSFLDSNPEVGMVGTAFYKMDISERILEKWIMPAEDQEIRKVMIRHNPFAHPSVMIRKDVFDAAGHYGDFPATEDYELWFRIAAHCKLANLSEPLMLWRYHEKGVTFSKQKTAIRNALKVRLRAIINRDYPVLSIIHLTKSIVMMLLPPKIREEVRRHYKRSNILVECPSIDEIKTVMSLL